MPELKELYLSLSLTMPVPSFSFGIVGMMSMNLGHETKNGVSRPVTVTALATSEYSIYFSMERVSFGTLVETFVGGGIKIPSAFHSIISIGSVTVSFNPSFSAIAPTQTEAPTASSLVAQYSSDCDNIFSLMQFQPIPGGVSEIIYTLLI